VVRPAVVFGPRNFANVYRMIDQIARRRFLPVGRGRNRKSMVFVTNIVQAILYLWMRPAPAEGTEIYNYVDKPDLTSREIVSAVYRGLGRREPAVRLPLTPALWAAKPFDLLVRLTGRNLPITSERIEKLADLETSFLAQRVRDAGFTQPVSLPEGLATMVRWYLAEGRDAEPVVHLPPEQPVIRS
jgi:nucleoside-diphosphate-sugar epimerase